MRTKSGDTLSADRVICARGSAISANPGVNPSRTITALAERAMSLIESKRS